MQKYILEGAPHEVAKVIQENRIRVERGVISFTPVQPGTVLDLDSIETLQESHHAAQEECQRMAASQIELAGIASNLVAIIVTSGQTIPDDMVTKLDSFGVYVPPTAETVPNDTDPVEDSKNIDVEDKTDANLDDVKEAVATSEDAPGNDTKDVPPADTKEAAAPKTKRTKKAE